MVNRQRPGPRVFLFVSGKVSSDDDGSPELETQVMIALDNLNAILTAVSCASGTAIATAACHESECPHGTSQ